MSANRSVMKSILRWMARTSHAARATPAACQSSATSTKPPTTVAILRHWPASWPVSAVAVPMRSCASDVDRSGADSGATGSAPGSSPAPRANACQAAADGGADQKRVATSRPSRHARASNPQAGVVPSVSRYSSNSEPVPVTTAPRYSASARKRILPPGTSGSAVTRWRDQYQTAAWPCVQSTSNSGSENGAARRTASPTNAFRWRSGTLDASSARNRHSSRPTSASVPAVPPPSRWVPSAPSLARLGENRRLRRASHV